MPTFRIDWKNWSDGKVSANVYRIADGVLVATHVGERNYVWKLIVRRGYNR